MNVHGLPRAERLRGNKILGRLFTDGQSGFVFPFRYYWQAVPVEDEDYSVAMLVSVPKKMFKRAVKRNLFKRRTREAFRQEKTNAVERCAAAGLRLSVAFVYSSKEEVEFGKIRSSVRRILSEVSKEAVLQSER